ncbi:MAG: HigA family addiction module antitoxin [Bryobacterales bacterium]|nr:HigA family addiction module antitoxin [Bryobacterales bacterium]
MSFPHNPAHPGDVIRDGCLGDEPPRSAAVRLGLDPIAFEKLVRGRGRITPDLAVRMQAVGWSNASFWVRLQANYDSDQEILRQGHAA